MLYDAFEVTVSALVLFVKFSLGILIVIFSEVLKEEVPLINI